MLISIFLGLFIFISTLPKAFFGLDFNDTGFHLYNGLDAFKNQGIKHFFNYPLWWMSDYIAGFFYSLNDNYSLIINRIINAFFSGFNVFTVCFVSQKKYSINALKKIILPIFALGVSSAFYFTNYHYKVATPFTFDYISIPSVFIILETSLLFWLLEKKYNLYLGFLIGILFFFAFNTRLTAIFFLLNIIIVIYVINKSSRKNAIFFLLSFSISFLALEIFFLYKIFQFNEIISFKTLNGGYQIKSSVVLLERIFLYLNDFLNNIKLPLVLSLFIFFAKNKINHNILYFFFAVLSYFILIKSKIITISYLLFIICSILLFNLKNIRNFFPDLIIIGISISAIGLGSDTGIIKCGAGLSLFIFLISKFHLTYDKFLLTIFNIFSLILIFLLLKINYKYNYLDSSTKFLTKKSDLNKLHNIFTSTEKYKNIKELELFSNKILNKNDYIYIYPHHPIGNYMLYNILNAKVITNNFLFSGKCYDSFNEIKKFCISDKKPKLFIQSKYQITNANPQNLITFDKVFFLPWCNEERNQKKFINEIKNVIIKSCNLKKVFENEMFIVYK